MGALGENIWKVADREVIKEFSEDSGSGGSGISERGTKGGRDGKYESSGYDLFSEIKFGLGDRRSSSPGLVNFQYKPNGPRSNMNNALPRSSLGPSKSQLELERLATEWVPLGETSRALHKDKSQ